MPGYQSRSLPIAGAGQFVGGFDLLPGGNHVVFDGAAVVERDAATGQLVRTLYSPPGFVFGAFVRIGPGARHLYFGESLFGEIIEVDLSTLAHRVVVTTAGLPFDLVFDSAGRAYLAWLPLAGAGSVVSELDLQSGLLDDVVRTSDFSGPLAFDAVDRLLLVVPDSSDFPSPPDSSPLLRYSREQVAAARGPSTLNENDGTLLGMLDGAFGMALDEAGDVFVSDSGRGNVIEVDAETGAESLLYQGSASTGYLRHQPGSHAGVPGAFEPFQPVTSGSLVVTETDFFSFNEARIIEPARPVLSLQPASPVPPGPFQVQLQGGVPNGRGLILRGVALLPEERSVGAGAVPLFVGLDLRGRVSLSMVRLDGFGNAQLNLHNPGMGGRDGALQMLVGPLTGSLTGSSQPLAILLQ